MFCQMTVLPLAAVCVIIYFLKTKKLSMKEAFGIKKQFLLKNVIQGVICYLAIMPFVIITSYFYIQMLTRLGVNVDYQPVIEVLVNPVYPGWIHLTLLVLAVISAPIVEEIIFRGIILPLAMNKMTTLSAVLFVAIFFSAVHAHMPALVPIFILAIGLALGYISTGSIIVPIVAHAMFNTVSITAFLLLKDSLL